MHGSIHFNRMALYFRKRTGIYTNSTGSLTYNVNTGEAHSYSWWKFVARVEGKVVFNNYRYSVSTSKHQSKIRSLLGQLGIKIDIELPLPKGINSSSLAELYLTAEEYLCDDILAEELKRDERNAKARQRRKVAKLTDYLETQVNFRDYDIVEKEKFGNPHLSIATKVAVHQVVDMDSLERDVESALHSFHRDGFGSVVFYV